MNLRVWKYPELEKQIEKLSGKRIVLVGGCFDIIHYGHIVFLEKAKKAGDILIIALESDEFIEKKKKRTPIHSQEERAYILTALSVVDYVILLPFFESDIEYNTLVTMVKPSVVAVTEGDHHVGKKREHVEKVGGTIQTVSPLLQKFSTTNILDYEDIHRS